MAVPCSVVTRARETIIRVQQLYRPAAEKHDRTKPEVDEPETEVDADESAAASPLPASDWRDVLTRDTTVEGQVGLEPLACIQKYQAAKLVEIRTAYSGRLVRRSKNIIKCIN